MTNKTVLSDDAMLPLEFKSGNCIPVSRALITKDRMIEILRATMQAVLQSPEIQQAIADSKRIDWLADPNNNIGNVQLPSEVVENNLHSLRDAIDAAMEATNE